MTMGTCSTQAYGEAWYWDKRYAHESGPFDWYQNYSTMAPLINLYLPRSHGHHRILVVGCGNSAFSEEMADDGYAEVVNIDISSVVIEAMQKKHSNRPQLTWTLDSLLCGNNSRLNAGNMLEEVWRVLKDKGVYILITYGAPTYRLHLLRDSCLWTIKLHVIEKLVSGESPEHPIWKLTDPVPLDDDGSSVEAVLGQNPDIHYIYICTKDLSLKAGPKHEVAVE
ncbi:uncharacterized protein LOC133877174 isoform X2 [Alnus glutinosa]|uniref:uncharacterized protein LOC133877174 isoform X2 n=1 Tax=Alnus glutinosa TaxID=3517 RepID=UPI002D78B4A8|nr:uncharacterized protein LOC133877174 isoform X2 [Alnus glutinosa]